MAVRAQTCLKPLVNNRLFVSTSVSELATFNAQKKVLIPIRLMRRIFTICTREQNYCALGSWWQKRVDRPEPFLNQFAQKTD